MSHLVLHITNTSKYVMAVLTRMQGKLCDKTVYRVYFQRCCRQDEDVEGLGFQTG